MVAHLRSRQSRGYHSNAGRVRRPVYQDTRYLSHLELRINEKRPLLLGSNISDDNFALFVDLTNPDFILWPTRRTPKDVCTSCAQYSFGAIRCISDSGCTIIETSRSTFAYRYRLRTDFADLFEYVDRTASVVVSSRQNFEAMTRVLLNYLGLDAKVRHTTLTFDPPPDRLATSVAVYDLRFAPGEMRPLFLTAGCDQAKIRPLPFLRSFIAARRWMREAARGRTSVEISNGRFNDMLCQSAADLAMLMRDTPQGGYPDAGNPLVLDNVRPRRPRHGAPDALVDPDVARGSLQRQGDLPDRKSIFEKLRGLLQHGRT